MSSGPSPRREVRLLDGLFVYADPSEMNTKYDKDCECYVEQKPPAPPVEMPGYL